MLALLLVALFAPVLAPHHPGEQDLLHTLAPPAWTRGRRLELPARHRQSRPRHPVAPHLWRARGDAGRHRRGVRRRARWAACLALIAGYYGGWPDWIIGRAVDVWMSFPPVILSLILMVGFGAGLNNVILAIIIVDWTRFCRVVRAEVLAVAKRDYIPAARLAGFSHLQVVLKEIAAGGDAAAPHPRQHRDGDRRRRRGDPVLRRAFGRAQRCRPGA